MFPIEQVMCLAETLRRLDTHDEDLKVVQLLGMRLFNAFGASLKLSLSGYIQNAAMIMRDILETHFLIDLFQGDRKMIEKWRLADKKTQRDLFSPVAVRLALDERDGFTSRRRAEHYRTFSELAAHPNMKSVFMMRPSPDGDAVIGPFIESSTLSAIIAELGRLAVLVGEKLDHFFPEDWKEAKPTRRLFAKAHED
ncbi:MAG: hypothetical protein ACR2RA_23350, partial [Geminicoccaceae bacterium]